MGRPGEITAIVTIAPGASWPDRISEVLANATLGQGGVVALVFASLVDAANCMSRLDGSQTSVLGGAA